MFVVYQRFKDDVWVKNEGEWNHKYFKSKENAEYYVRELRKRTTADVKLEEIRTED